MCITKSAVSQKHFAILIGFSALVHCAPKSDAKVKIDVLVTTKFLFGMKCLSNRVM